MVEEIHFRLRIATTFAEKIAKKAHKEGLTLREAALALEMLSDDEFTEWVDPKKMI